MRLSKYFLPLLKENPQEAQIISHRFMLRAGMIRQTSAGIYTWLPLGFRVLRKIEQIVREEQNAAGAQEVLMPTLQSADLWKQSGRYEAYGKEMLRIRDRHDREMLYGPTNEEMITDIFKSACKSYKDLPKHLYHIQWKFRDEIRPRFGLMRGREFLMKDNYSFDLTYEDALRSYQMMFLAYIKTFKRLGIQAIPMRADTGPIGGNLSHEFIILAVTGESQVFCDQEFMKINDKVDHVSYHQADEVKSFFEKWTSHYAATDEMHKPDECSLDEKSLVTARGIEVGHIFYFGTKYSEAMQAYVTDREGKQVLVEMGSYGVGISRLVAAIIEASHDEQGIIWPESVSPFHVVLINMKPSDKETNDMCELLYILLTESDKGIDVLYDDTSDSPGEKFARADLVGVPFQLIIGPKGIAQGEVELKHRKTGEKQKFSLNLGVSGPGGLGEQITSFIASAYGL